MNEQNNARRETDKGVDAFAPLVNASRRRLSAARRPLSSAKESRAERIKIFPSSAAKLFEIAPLLGKRIRREYYKKPREDTRRRVREYRAAHSRGCIVPSRSSPSPPSLAYPRLHLSLRDTGGPAVPSSLGGGGHDRTSVGARSMPRAGAFFPWSNFQASFKSESTHIVRAGHS